MYTDKPEGKRPLLKHMHGWEDNVKIYVKVIGYEGVNWNYMT
jgi:hypothetical protein